MSGSIIQMAGTPDAIRSAWQRLREADQERRTERREPVRSLQVIDGESAQQPPQLRAGAEK